MLTPTPVAARADELGLPVLETDAPRRARATELAAARRRPRRHRRVRRARARAAAELAAPRLDQPALLAAPALARCRAGAARDHRGRRGDGRDGVPARRRGSTRATVFAQERETIGAHRHRRSASRRAQRRGLPPLLGGVVDAPRRGHRAPRAARRATPTFAPKLVRDDGRIDWGQDPPRPCTRASAASRLSPAHSPRPATARSQDPRGDRIARDARSARRPARARSTAAASSSAPRRRRSNSCACNPPARAAMSARRLVRAASATGAPGSLS